ncbi:hypothetical protein EJ06DRAFT_529260 [Trichodelitschia bisporula]|uniref:Uncharacterized protein n=1 Tax=Trichodelitschia bisporula TaxID=703511 RepID=A0A6G1HYG7_9PEZI|nr:hypothetical protein EJ06DRAFT_529260 [Trichodelitschia bisporula]
MTKALASMPAWESVSSSFVQLANSHAKLCLRSKELSSNVSGVQRYLQTFTKGSLATYLC